MKLRSVNVSLPRTVHDGERVVETGIFKEPVVGPAWIRSLNLDGDGQADLENHGGPDKAVYAYPTEHWAHWRRHFPALQPRCGLFGENLSLEGMVERTVGVGDIMRVGGAVLQVTQPRVPCFKLGLRTGLPGLPKAFLRSHRVGFYLRVLEEGAVEAGDAIELAERSPGSMSVHELLHLHFFDRDNVGEIERALNLGALSADWRQSFETLLEVAAHEERS